MVRSPLTRSEIALLAGLVLLLAGAIAARLLLRNEAPDVRVVLASEEPITYRINLNTASAEELTLLPGIGPVKARRIVEHRRRQGPLTSFDDLKDISGISATLAERIAERATLCDPPPDP